MGSVHPKTVDSGKVGGGASKKGTRCGQKGSASPKTGQKGQGGVSASKTGRVAARRGRCVQKWDDLGPEGSTGSKTGQDGTHASENGTRCVQIEGQGVSPCVQIETHRGQ